MGVVFMNAANPRRGEQHRPRPIFIKPAVDRSLVAQIDRVTADGQNLALLLRQPADECRPDHAAMAGNKYALAVEREYCRLFHVSVASRYRGTAGWIGKPRSVYGLLAPCELDIVLDHHLDQLCETNPRLPAEDVARLGSIAAQRIDFGRPKIAAVDLDMAPPI